ncbi:polymer-forming cytoskeletal protein [Acidovorax sp. MR-S7]|uniref:bactofilin family protein n=1 Tax=unclassified Acidovorax TaxID=2684926 RepID=UPI00037972B0|nr:polymer-forming cytoskeletal protein [Acidovorax sp. MR-S7]GAD20349.1 integral membrane protein CcmA involved in cell shape determination [Acidovorax sp. MR-S7]
MFSRKKQPPIKSLIAQGTHVQGDLSFTDGLRIDGEVVGDVRSTVEPSILVVSELGRVQGALHASHVIVNGTVEGPVHAAELLEVQPKARIMGNVHYKALEMHQGAVISGQMCPASTLLLEEKPTLKLASNAT